MQHDFSRLGERERRSIVIGALVAMFVSALDSTIVAPSLPTMAVALGHAEWLPWVITTYLLVGTAVTPLYGKIADIRGRRPTLYAAIGIFLAGSVFCGMATSMPALIVARAIQGLGGGGIIAVSQTIIGDVVAPRERGQYQAYISGLWATASIAGPVLGGVLTQHVHWSAIFWINLPVGIVAVLLVRRALGRLPDVRHAHRLDIVGSLLVSSGTVAILLGLTFGSSDGRWGDPLTLSLILVGAVIWGVFLRHLFRTAEPLVPPRVVLNPVIGAALASQFFITGVNVGLSIYTPAFFETVLGLTPASSGTAMLALMVGTVGGGAVTGRSMRRGAHYRRFALWGTFTASIVFAIMAAALPWLSFWMIEVGLFLAGFAFSAAFPVVMVSVQNAAAREDLGVATATVAFVRSIGAMGGVAAYGTILISIGAVATVTSEGAAHAADPVAMAEGYRLVLLGASVAILAGFFCLTKMRELPLRGHADVAPEPPAGPGRDA